MTEEHKRAADLILGARLSAPIPDKEHRVADLFSTEVLPVLSRLGAEATLVEVYSPNRATSCKEIHGHHYVVFDHGVSESMGLLEGLLGSEEPPHVVAAALQRAMAEASRAAGRADLYSFFIRRAVETAKASTFPSPKPDGRVATAQVLLILLHECAHALPAEHELRKAAWDYAVLKFSALSTQWIHMMSAELASVLEFDLPNLPADALEEWIRFRDALGVNDDQLGEAIAAISTDDRFRGEIACDRIALVFQQLILENHRANMDEAEFLQLSEDVFAASFNAFLHLRLFKYIDDFYEHLPQHVLSEKINPLNLKLVVETGLRSTLVGQLVIDAAKEVGGHDHAQRLLERIGRLQDGHRERLFVPLSELLEMTILNAEFHSTLPDLLAQDGVRATSRGATDMQVAFDADDVWLELARGRAERGSNMGFSALRLRRIASTAFRA